MLCNLSFWGSIEGLKIPKFNLTFVVGVNERVTHPWGRGINESHTRGARIKPQGRSPRAWFGVPEDVIHWCRDFKGAPLTFTFLHFCAHASLKSINRMTHPLAICHWSQWPMVNEKGKSARYCELCERKMTCASFFTYFGSNEREWENAIWPESEDLSMDPEGREARGRPLNDLRSQAI